MDNTIRIIPIVISAVALLVSLYNILSNKNRGKKQATLDAFDKLQREVLDGIRSVKKKDTNKLGAEGEAANPELWKQLTLYLIRIERFSVGVNTGVYDINVLNRLAGSYLIDMYYFLKPVIDKKRNISTAIKKPKKKTYDEFEKVVGKLEKIRKRVPKQKD